MTIEDIIKELDTLVSQLEQDKASHSRQLGMLLTKTDYSNENSNPPDPDRLGI